MGGKFLRFSEPVPVEDPIELRKSRSAREEK